MILRVRSGCLDIYERILQAPAETAVMYGKVMFLQRKASKTPAEKIHTPHTTASRTSAVFSK